MSIIKGRVIDYDTDAPIPGVLVQGANQDGTFFSSTTTDATGNYTVEHAGFDNLYSQMRFSKDGYAVQTMRPASANNVDVILPKAGTLGAVTLTLKRNKDKVILFLILGAALAFIYFKYGKKLLK